MESNPRDGSAPAASPDPEAGYGLHPAARPAVARYVETVTHLVETCEADDLHEAVSEALRPVLADPDVLAPEHRLADDARYRRHVLFADPGGRFSVLALVWKPGQRTEIHGHAAWCAVGVYEGRIGVCTYDCKDLEAPREVSDRAYEQGAVSGVRPGLDDAHRIYNGSDEIAVTIHTYGLDLVAAPEAINVVVTD